MNGLTHADDLPEGERVGSYCIESPIGRGGMGTVYRAIHQSIGSRVAIKVLARERSANPNAVARFFDEARAAAAIGDDHIVYVIDAGTLTDGRPYIMMEHLDGDSLETILARGRLPFEEAVRIALETLAGLAAAHARGIVHRDIKPANLFVTRSGRIRILDFGIAKLLPEEFLSSAREVSGAVIGTPRYMAPEQVRGQPVDARADLYALGLVLYESLAGAPPFDAPDTYELLRLQVEVPPAPLRSIDPAVPEPLERVVSRLLAKSPHDRHADATEVGAELARALHLPAPQRLHPVSPGAVTPPANTGAHGFASTVADDSASPRTPSHRRMPRALLLSLGVAALAVTAILVWLGRPSPDHHARQTTSAEPQVTRTAQPAPAGFFDPPASSADPNLIDGLDLLARARDLVLRPPDGLRHARLVFMMLTAIDATGLVDLRSPNTIAAYAFADSDRCVYVGFAASGTTRSPLRADACHQYRRVADPTCRTSALLAHHFPAGTKFSDNATLMYPGGAASSQWSLTSGSRTTFIGDVCH